MRVSPKPEEIFYDSVRALITNLIVKHNDKSPEYYMKHYGYSPADHLIKQGKYILEKMEDWKHLIIDDEEEGKEQNGQ